MHWRQWFYRIIRSIKRHPLPWILTPFIIGVILILWALGAFSHLHWGVWYHWFWHDVCGCYQPFTYYMRESAQAHPYWWILTPIVLGVGFYLWLWFGDINWWNNTSERKKHLIFYLGSIAIGVVYYILICHLWSIL